MFHSAQDSDMVRPMPSGDALRDHAGPGTTPSVPDVRRGAGLAIVEVGICESSRSGPPTHRGSLGATRNATPASTAKSERCIRYARHNERTSFTSKDLGQQDQRELLGKLPRLAPQPLNHVSLAVW